MVGSLIAGAVVVESVFAWPGVGRLLVSAVANRDLAVVQAILLVIAAWMVMANFIVDIALRLARSAPARRGGGTLTMAVRDALPAAADRTSTLGTIARRVARLPFAVSLATLWLVLMVVIALRRRLSCCPIPSPRFDLKARLAPPVLFGGTVAHPLGTDELGRDVLSRLIMSIRMSLLIALFGTLIAATFGTALGFLAAHFRG